jgi:hypothetical protein
VLALALLVPLAVGALAMAGFADSGRSSAAVAPKAACLHGRSARSSDVASGFPLPGSTVLFSRSRERGARVVRGRISGSLFPIRDFFARSLPASGYVLGAGDAEAYEAETDFIGRGVRGHIKLNTSFACLGTVELAVVLR